MISFSSLFKRDFFLNKEEKRGSVSLITDKIIILSKLEENSNSVDKTIINN